MQESKKIRCLVIDDELPAREILKKHIAGVDALELWGVCSNAMDAVSFLKDHMVDLLFLDIQMPHLLGTSFLRTLKNAPRVIFTTAYRKYAVEGFELDAVDYLLKPISFERFLKGVNKVLQLNLQSNLVPSESSAGNAAPFLYFRSNRKMVKVMLNEIVYIEGLNDYIKIVAASKTIISKHVLSSLEEMLPSNLFVRIHKSFIVAINKIESFDADSVEIGKREIPIGRFFKSNLARILNSSAASETTHANNQTILKRDNGSTSQ